MRYAYFHDFILGDKKDDQYCITGNLGIGKNVLWKTNVTVVELLQRKKVGSNTSIWEGKWSIWYIVFQTKVVSYQLKLEQKYLQWC